MRGPKHGVPRGVAVDSNPRHAPDPARLDDLLGRCERLRGWARAHGITLSGVPEDLELLDWAIGEWAHDPQAAGLGSEAGLFLGTVIIGSVAGACWRMWPDGHPVVRLRSGRELDVVALANSRVTSGYPRLAEAFADAAATGPPP
jgi:hypothetical protein